MVNKGCSCFGEKPKPSIDLEEEGLIDLSCRIRKGLMFPHYEVREEDHPIVIQFFPPFRPFEDGGYHGGQ